MDYIIRAFRTSSDDYPIRCAEVLPLTESLACIESSRNEKTLPAFPVTGSR